MLVSTNLETTSFGIMLAIVENIITVLEFHWTELKIN